MPRNSTRCMKRSIREPEKFWLEQARTLEWFKKPTVARKFTWDTDARKIRAHLVRGRPAQRERQLPRPPSENARHKTAIIWQGEPEEDVKRITYAELHARSASSPTPEIARHQEGRPRGDLHADDSRGRRAVMLGCARIGAIHSVVFGGFSADSLADRINDSDLQTAHHGERLAARRQNHSAQGHRRRGVEKNPEHRKSRRRQTQRRAVQHHRRPRRLVSRFDGEGFRRIAPPEK
jgi:acyl-CoA synthetase (AMP-forming)/AMP-acid ligase II